MRCAGWKRLRCRRILEAAKDHCTDISKRAAQTRAGMHCHVGLAAGTCTDTSTHASQDTSAHATETPFVGGSLDCRRGPCRQVLEVASFVPGHVRNRGATPWSWTALCSKKNKVATPLHSNRMERQRHVTPFLGSHAAYQVSKAMEVEVAMTSADEPQAWCPRSWQHPRNVSALHGQRGARLSGAPSPTPPWARRPPLRDTY